MASADLKKGLECSVCLNVYNDPITLRCGHNFCRACIDRVLDTQEETGCYSCPECREEYQERPALQRNRTLRNIAENLLTTPPDQVTTILCTYCIHSPVPAVKSCLHCEASLCEDHLKVHSKSPEHVLLDPTTSLENRKCSVHKEILKYYCTEDTTCICVSCSLAGEHRGHQVETLDEASRKKKERLRDALQKLMTERQETEKRAQSLQERRREVQEEAAGETARVTAMFRDLRRRLEDLEKRVLSDISRQAECRALSDWIQQLEIKKAELSRKMGDMEALCHMTDPLTVLQQLDTGDLCDTEEGGNEDRQRHDEQLHDGGGLDVAGISHTLHTGLSDIIRGVTGGVYIAPADILLDVNTAHNNLHISDDRKTVSLSHIKQNRPETPDRFQWGGRFINSASRSFSSRHYWEVDVGGSDCWIVGMCYPSIDRGGDQSVIGDNNKSWGLDRYNNQYEVGHDSKVTAVGGGISSNRVRVELDYEAGLISFYDLCDPIRHLHTFTTTFTEPLHAALYVGTGCIKISDVPRKYEKEITLHSSGFALQLSVMASAELRKELECSICLNVYTDPVMLKCGHNFCRVCIARVLDTQKRSKRYSCPECREKFQERPALQSNRILHNIAENLLTTHQGQVQIGICCTYCIHAPVPAVKSCLHCEASLCEDHLRAHSKSREHVLLDPTTSLENRKCSVHKKILEYYCTEDAAYLCMSCRLDGEHQGHKVQTLDEAFNKKKEILKNNLQKFMTKKKETEKRLQSLQARYKEAETIAARETAKVTAMFRDLRRQLKDLEKRVLSDISRQTEVGALSDWIRQLEIKKAELSRKMGDMEELCDMTDPLTVLQQSDTGDLCDTEEGGNEDRDRHDEQLHDGGGLDEAGITHTIHTGLSDILVSIAPPAHILLDVNTAHDILDISDDRTNVSRSHKKQNQPKLPERFQDYPQVLSSRSFSSGHHYWEVNAGGSDYWTVGMCYPSMDRRGGQSAIGNNNKSWGLYRDFDHYEVGHDRKWIRVAAGRIKDTVRVRIVLDYETGRISFYLCDPLQHLHTFTAIFTEPLYAALHLWAEILQSTTVFPLLNYCMGDTLEGCLDVAKETWENETTPNKCVIEHVEHKQSHTQE
ncbi:LOW QUALITY PROTEIN: uncharacterized protein PAF06_006506 [Gastrophryne carolinensis]